MTQIRPFIKRLGEQYINPRNKSELVNNINSTSDTNNNSNCNNTKNVSRNDNDNSLFNNANNNKNNNNNKHQHSKTTYAQQQQCQQSHTDSNKSQFRGVDSSSKQLIRYTFLLLNFSSEFGCK